MKSLLFHQDARFLAVVSLLVFGTLLAELYLFRLTRKAEDELFNQNQVRHQVNGRTRAEIEGLKASQTKIDAMFLRLNDAIFNPRSVVGMRGHSDSPLGVRSFDLDARPPAIQLLADAGLVVQPGRAPNGESSVMFEAGSSRLELERLIPLLAEEENSNAFLYLDRLYLSRPVSSKPFSPDPTYLDARFSIRLLTAK